MAGGRCRVLAPHGGLLCAAVGLPVPPCSAAAVSTEAATDPTSTDPRAFDPQAVEAAAQQFWNGSRAFEDDEASAKPK